MKLEVGFIAHPDIIAESLPAFNLGFRDQCEGHVAALRQQGQIALGRILQPDQIQV